jgi:DNA-directed RNA polymerase subunit RPC12/RpoP
MPHSLAPFIVIPVVLILAVSWQTYLSKNFDYQCGSCGERFTPSVLAAAVAPHRFGGRKLLRCPSCGKVTWASAVPKEQ